MLCYSSFNLEQPVTLLVALFKVDVLTQYVQVRCINYQFNIFLLRDVLCGFHALLVLWDGDSFVLFQLPLLGALQADLLNHSENDFIEFSKPLKVFSYPKQFILDVPFFRVSHQFECFPYFFQILEVELLQHEEKIFFMDCFPLFKVKLVQLVGSRLKVYFEPFIIKPGDGDSICKSFDLFSKLHTL